MGAEQNIKTVIGIDVGGSSTKIVGFRKSGKAAPELIEPILVEATDPVTSIYGAFGKFTSSNHLRIEDITGIMMTGAGSSVAKSSIFSLQCSKISEFSCVGRGGLFLSGLDEAVVVSMGTGTALIHAKKENGAVTTKYLGGTGVGGGTLLGLNRKILGVDTIDHIEQLCAEGDLNNVDLRIKDIAKNHVYDGINENLTAANFGKLSDLATPGDISLGIANMVAETILMVAVFAARGLNVANVVLVGNLTTLSPIRNVFQNRDNSFGLNFIIPERAQFGTVIGAALQGIENTEI